MTSASLERSLRLGVAQVESRSTDFDANLAAHLIMVERARRSEVDLLLFPELSLSGYLVADPRSWVADHAAGIDELRAKCGQMRVVFGQPWQEGSEVRNSAIVLSRDGVIARQDKRYLLNYGVYTEGDRFDPGSGAEILAVEDFRVSVHICEDAWHTSVAHEARLRGADVFLHPAASAMGAIGEGISSQESWPLVNRAQAMLHGAYVAFANHVGTDGGQTFWGGSSITSPFGRVIVEAAGLATELVVAEITRAELEGARRAYRMMDDEIDRQDNGARRR
jgi:N-carbamoylputrescine amidase